MLMRRRLTQVLAAERLLECFAELQRYGEMERLHSTAHAVSETYGESIS